MTTVRRTFLKNAVATGIAASLPAIGFAQSDPSAQSAARRFVPRPGDWRTFEVTTRVEILIPQGATRVWLPIPCVDSDYQRSLESSYTSNGQTQRLADNVSGAQMLYVEFPAREVNPVVTLTSRVQTQSRAVDWSARHHAHEDADTLRHWLQPTALVPLDGIVRQTALQAAQGASTDVEKVRAIYHWILANTYREPKVRGCGEGDIKTMLETGNLGGKCADLNAIFVGLCRAVGVPARDLYGVRLASSAFDYKTLGANPAGLQRAQHCRSEVFLKEHGWVAMDPADVAKVMREETPQWIKSTQGGVVGPVSRALFGGWEGNWMAYSSAVDVVLPHSSSDKLGFFMYPAAENAGGRLDPYSPDDFSYQIMAKEIKA